MWLYRFHPEELMECLQFVPRHIFWRDLTALIEILVLRKENEKEEIRRRALVQIANSPRSPEENLDCQLELIARGMRPPDAYDRFLRSLLDPTIRTNAKKKYQEITLNLKKEREEASNEALSELTQDPTFKKLYDATVSIFATTIRHNVDKLKKGIRLQSSAFVGKWAPCVPGLVDDRTNLGKNVARSLYAMDHAEPQEFGESESEENAILSYRNNYLTPLQAGLNTAFDMPPNRQ